MGLASHSSPNLNQQTKFSIFKTHIYTQRKRETDRAQTETERQGPDRETERETEMKNLRKTYPKLLALKHVFTEELPFFFPEFYQFTPTTYQNKKAQAVRGIK